MQVGFGKHSDLIVQRLLLRYPDYILWMGQQESPGGPMLRVLGEVNRLIIGFDAKPPTKKCGGCNNNATRASGYIGNPITLYWWCEDCNPYSYGAVQGKLMDLRTYRDAIAFAGACGEKRSDYRSVVKAFAEGKGAPDRMTENALTNYLP